MGDGVVLSYYVCDSVLGIRYVHNSPPLSKQNQAAAP
jgi:hypothetical protein